MAKDNKEYGPLNIMSQADVVRLLKVATSTVQKFRNDPSFPPRRNFGRGAKKGWLYRDIVSWLENQPFDEGV
jgi:predicted DNA-binding transcriptional regulator AlpA